MRVRRLLAGAGTVIFAATVPGTVVGVVPYRLAGGRIHPPLGGSALTRVAGAALVLAGAPFVADSFARFVKAAGTPAPAFETEELVVEGFYRRTRNPQYVGVLLALAGESLLYGSRRVLAYTAAVGAGFHAWVVLYEEPRLRRRFGRRYGRYARETPRWLPQVRPTSVSRRALAGCSG